MPFTYLRLAARTRFGRTAMLFATIMLCSRILFPGQSGFAQSAPNLPSDESPQISAIALDVPTHASSTGDDVAAPAFVGCGGASTPAVEPGYEQAILELVNQERAANGLPPLRANADLTNAARYHSVDMAQDAYFNHDSYDRTGDELIKACDWYIRVRTFYAGGSRIGENIAWNYRSPEEVMQGWMNSAGHRANILGDYREMGIGFYDWYWSQDFGKRDSVYPLIINGEAAATASTELTLYVYGDWQEVRLRNNGDDWTPWQSFANEINWSIPAIPGLHTVEVNVRNAETQLTSSDTIEYVGPSQDPILPTATPVEEIPTAVPTEIPTEIPTEAPTEMPTVTPAAPTVEPTQPPVETPSIELPTVSPTALPTQPTVDAPTATPTEMPDATEQPLPATPLPATPQTVTPSPTDMPAPSPVADFHLHTATYLGGSGADSATGLDIAPDGSIYIAGAFTGFDANAALLQSQAETTAPRGAVLRLTDQGQSLYSVTLIGEYVNDIEVDDQGDMVVCGSFGIARLTSNAGALAWYDNSGDGQRCGLGADGVAALLVDNTIRVYDGQGALLGSWPAAKEPGDSSDVAVDVAVASAQQSIIVTGQRQLADGTQIVTLRAWSYDGTLRWSGYEFATNDGLTAATSGRRIAIGRDGLLYLAATVQGSTDDSIFSRGPRRLESSALAQTVRTDVYTDPQDVGTATVMWYGRYHPVTGDLILGQSLVARDEDGGGKSMVPFAITADREGRLYVAGSTWGAPRDQAPEQIDGEPVGTVEGGDPFLVVVEPEFGSRLLWTTFARRGYTGGDSPATGVAVRNRLAALAVTSSNQDGRRFVTDSDAVQPEPGGGQSDAYVAVWPQIESTILPIGQDATPDGARLYLPLLTTR